MIRAADPTLEIDGEMQADVAMDEEMRKSIFLKPRSQVRRICW